ncbi:MAG: hypothetical protein KKE76_06795, partial [Gammaproteobacteria bacterium]|nr:hypothetical protein [Gammaproteobacteria bacterium]
CRREKNNPFSLPGEGQEEGINIQAVFYFDTLSPALSQEGEGVTGTAVPVAQELATNSNYQS